MDGNDRLRQLLVADLALMQGLVTAQDVGAALMRAWEAEGEDALLRELARLADLPEGALSAVETEAARLVASAEGNAQRALTRHGVDRSVHAALGQRGAQLSRALTQLGSKVRAPLRALDHERYTNFLEVGEGGMGVVYMALDTELNRWIAFKLVRTPDEGDNAAQDASSSPEDASPPPPGTAEADRFEELQVRFLQEAWITGGLEHPGIVPLYELGKTSGGVPFYTMRLVRGARTLKDALEDAQDAPMEARLALLEPFLKLCDTVRYAHDKGVVHRDLKPANVALGEYGEAVLLDWGLAKLEGKEDVTGSVWQEKVHAYRKATDAETKAGAMGTPGYMSPEAALGKINAVDLRSDVYSLGAMLFEILAGRLPFEFTGYMQLVSRIASEDAPEAISLNPSVPQGLSDLCAEALSRDPEARPQSAAELATSIRDWQTESAIEREVAGHLRDVRSALSSAAKATGAERLAQVDRAAAALAQAESKGAGGRGVKQLQARIASLREEGMRERERATGRRLLKRVGVAALAVASIVAVLVGLWMDGKRKDAEDARAETGVALTAETKAREEADAARDETRTALTAAQASETKAQASETAAKASEAAAKTALAEKSAALDQVLRLADTKKVRDLVDEVDSLWPVRPDRAPAMAAWIQRASVVLANREEHEAALSVLQEQARPYTEAQRLADHAVALARIEAIPMEVKQAKDALNTLAQEPGKDEGDDEEAKAAAQKAAKTKREGLEKRIAQLELERMSLEAQVKTRISWLFATADADWRHEALLDLLEGLTALRDRETPDTGHLANVAARRAEAASIRKRSIDAHAAAWAATIKAIASSPEYSGLKLAPQVGLVPLGQDPESSLFEFAHLGSGSMPTRDPETKRLVQAEDAAIVLVLIPGGSFFMGAQWKDKDGRNYDPQAGIDESPVREVTLSPYFIGKYELSQAQWQVLTGGATPSGFEAGYVLGDKELTRRNPVEQVSWEDCQRWLPRRGLTLPTEAQWERAARAGTDTPWFTGRDLADLGKVANIADKYCKEHGGAASWPCTEEVDDGYTMHAPAGSLGANGIGLFDVHGNVWEWCLDTHRSRLDPNNLQDPLVTGPGVRVYRGGGFDSVASAARSANRYSSAPGYRAYRLGARPARPITSD